MADTKISALTDGATAAATDAIPVARAGANRYITPAYIKDYILGLASALSAPAANWTGTWITGGTATTTKPHILIEPTGTTSTGWSTAGTGLGVNAATGFAGNLIDVQLSGTSKFKVTSAGDGTIVSLTATSYLLSQSIGTGVDSTTATIAWGAANDVKLARDAANTLAQRNSTNAQTFRVYNFYTDASNYERGYVQYSGNVLQIGHEAAGTGTASRNVEFYRGSGNLFLRYDASSNRTYNYNDVYLQGASLLVISSGQSLGYGAGAGGTVTQATSRTTGVTLNTACGAITLFSAAGSATPASFTVTNSVIVATDQINLSVKSGTNKYVAFVTAKGAGSFEITFWSASGTATDAPVITFSVEKAVEA